MQAEWFLFGAGILSGGMNALAGGGSFVSLPALIAAGVPAVQANASSTVALWPGGAAGAWTYWAGPPRVCGIGPVPLVILTLIGGLVGSLTLLLLPAAAFNAILPWLMLLATLALSFGRHIGVALQGRLAQMRGLVMVVQFVLGFYGGYFGGAVGLMMFATWSLFGEGDLKALQSPRTLLTSAANTTALIVFIVAGAVWWRQTIPMLLGGLVGGVLGARLGRVLPASVVRIGTIVTTVVITAAFFWRAYG